MCIHVCGPRESKPLLSPLQMGTSSQQRPGSRPQQRGTRPPNTAPLCPAARWACAEGTRVSVSKHCSGLTSHARSEVVFWTQPMLGRFRHSGLQQGALWPEKKGSACHLAQRNDLFLRWHLTRDATPPPTAHRPAARPGPASLPVPAAVTGPWLVELLGLRGLPKAAFQKSSWAASSDP